MAGSMLRWFAVSLCPMLRAEGKTNESLVETRVLVLGAGAAGIAASAAFHRQGMHEFLVIEGGPKIGGRIKDFMLGAPNMSSGSLQIQFGANWIQGTQGNWLHSLTEKANIPSIETDYFDYAAFDRDKGRIDATAAQREYNRTRHKLDEISRSSDVSFTKDISIEVALALAGWRADTPLKKAITWYQTEFEYAKSPSTTSLKYNLPRITHAHFKKADSFVNGNFAGILDDMSREFQHKIRLHEIVQDIIPTSDGKVQVRTRETLSNKTVTYLASRVLLTFSLGVLQHDMRALFPNPPLPEWKAQAIHRFEFGDYMKIFLVFDAKFWPDNEFVLWASGRKGYFPLWQNMNHPKYFGVNQSLKVWMVTVVDSEAQRIEMQSEAETKEELVSAYRSFLQNHSLPEPLKIVFYRWHSDPLFRGAYSNWPTGMHWREQRDLAKPVFDDLVWFAGEHCDPDYNGYVHGALLSGNDSAVLMMKCMDDPSMCPSNDVPWVIPLIITVLLGVGAVWILRNGNSWRMRVISVLSVRASTCRHMCTRVRLILPSFLAGLFQLLAEISVLVCLEWSIDKSKGHYGEQRRQFPYHTGSVFLVSWFIVQCGYWGMWQCKVWRTWTIEDDDVMPKMSIRSKGSVISTMSRRSGVLVEVHKGIWKRMERFRMFLMIVTTGFSSGSADLLEMMAVGFAGPELVSVVSSTEVFFSAVWACLLLRGTRIRDSYICLLLILILAQVVFLGTQRQLPRTMDDVVELRSGGARLGSRGDLFTGIGLVTLAVLARSFSYVLATRIVRDGTLQERIRNGILIHAAEGIAIIPYCVYFLSEGHALANFFTGWDCRTWICLISMLSETLAFSIGFYLLSSLGIELISVVSSSAVFVLSILIFPPIKGSREDLARKYFQFESRVTAVIIFLVCGALILLDARAEEHNVKSDINAEEKNDKWMKDNNEDKSDICVEA